jgi:hypothetical protein
VNAPADFRGVRLIRKNKIAAKASFLSWAIALLDYIYIAKPRESQSFFINLQYHNF